MDLGTIDSKLQTTIDEAIENEGSFSYASGEYTFTKIGHKKAVTLFSFYSSVGNDLVKGNLSFLSFDDRYPKIERIIEDHTLFNGNKISTIVKHWENHPNDYMAVVFSALMYYTRPFF